MSDKPIYKGFSFFEYERTKNFKLTNVEIVKMDLLNHIFTAKGERFRQVTYGTSIPDITFEQMDSETTDQLYEELEAVFNFDPRVELLNMELTESPSTNSVTVAAQLRYVELNFVDTFELNITSD